ncbi:uncharacterized protein PRCAT00003259001 [Priceomyces carsonii]|uniref:uncharacterized protein n=1 Tax=Priceomyces carsonii TaxID=28549 RepID=UPI002ED8F96B|nr:unnamed protein product [Priceomyces carsonii]
MTSMRRVSRAQCANCTCSPGLLSRTNKRKSLFAKQIDIKRSGSVSPRAMSRQGSVFTIDVSSLCVPEVKEVNTSKRLEALRRVMAQHDLGVYIVPSEDQHQSEYVSAFDQKRSFISGFQGSAGVAIITRDVTSLNDEPEGAAALSTDGRYFNQATNELDFNWILLKQGAKGQPTWEEWAIDQACQLYSDSGKVIKIGVDPKLISYQLYQKMSALIKSKINSKKVNIELVPVKENLIDKIWGKFEEIPSGPSSIIKVLDDKYTGQSVAEKLSNVTSIIKKEGANGLIVSALDEIAWLLNLRGSDIDYNPVFYAYLIITDKNIKLFADNFRFDTKVQDSLRENKISVEPYLSFWKNLQKLSEQFKAENKKFLLSNSSSWEIARNIVSSYELVKVSPVEELKAVKNEVELRGAKAAHLKDGRALVRFFTWLENQLIDHQELIDEVEASDKLTDFRRDEENFVGLSFDTISATGSNASIIHYKSVKGSCSVINPNKIYLNDSGSQFLEGTTDTTRTVHFSEPTSEQIRNYTLVLKGNISLSNLKFPEGTTGTMIDSVARQYLWKEGLDYAHGTSHGVGSYLNVHEGPIGIGPRPGYASTPLKPGHLLSNEPGFYEDGEYGIRIENVMYVKNSGLKYNGKDYYLFETVTRVPFCRKLIDVLLLTSEEREWVDLYHKTVWKELCDSFPKNSSEYHWLKKETARL